MRCIFTLVLTLAVLLDNIGISLQVSFRNNKVSPEPREAIVRNEHPPPREPSPPRGHDLARGSHILRSRVTFPMGFYTRVPQIINPYRPYRWDRLDLSGHEVVVDANQKIVGILHGDWDNRLGGIFFGAIAPRIKVNEIHLGTYENMNDSDLARYPEFVRFAKPEEIYRDRASS